MYLTGIWKVLSWFAISVAATHLMNDPFTIKEKLQPRILLNLLCFCITRVVARTCHSNYDTSFVSGMYILNEFCYLTTSIGAIYFFYNSVIISREHLKRSIFQVHCVYFSTFVATIHIIKSCLWLIREKLNTMFIWAKPL